MSAEPGQTMKPLLRDPDAQRAFERDGFCVLRGALDAGDLERLRDLHAGSVHEALGDDQVYFSIAHTGKDNSLAIDRRIREIVEPGLAPSFVKPRFSAAQFIIKKAGPIGVLDPHQDMTGTLEPAERAAMVWSPLADVDIDGGGVGFVPGSHLFFGDTRCGPTVVNRRTIPFAGYARRLFPYMTFPRLSAGDSIVWDAAIAHGSLPNLTDGDRVVASVGVVRTDTPTVFNYLLPGTTRFERFEVGPEFWAEHNDHDVQRLHESGGRPEGLASMGVFEHEVTTIGLEDFVARVEAAGGRYDPEIAKRVAAIPGGGSKRQPDG